MVVKEGELTVAVNSDNMVREPKNLGGRDFVFAPYIHCCPCLHIEHHRSLAAIKCTHLAL